MLLQVLIQGRRQRRQRNISGQKLHGRILQVATLMIEVPLLVLGVRALAPAMREIPPQSMTIASGFAPEPRA